MAFVHGGFDVWISFASRQFVSGGVAQARRAGPQRRAVDAQRLVSQEVGLRTSSGVRSKSTVPLFFRWVWFKLRLLWKWFFGQARGNRRRLLAGAVPWLVLLTVPVLRSQLKTEPIGGDWLWPRLFNNNGPDSEALEAIAQHASQDALTQTALDGKYSPESYNYDRQIARYPDQVWLLAHRVLYGAKIEFNGANYFAGSAPDDRVAGELEQPELDAELSGSRRQRPRTGDSEPAVDLIPQYRPPVRAVEIPVADGKAELPPASPLDVYPDYSSEDGEDDFSGESPAAPSPNPPPAPTPSPPTKTVYVASRVDPLTVERELALATRGGAVDRNNAFWDMFRSLRLFGIRRDAEALDAFAAASRKAEFNRYGAEYAKLESIRAKVFHRYPALFQSRSDSAGDTWLGQVRHLIQLVVWHAALAERRGDHRKALSLYSDAMNFARLFRRDAFSVREALAGCALEAIVWAGVNRAVTVNEAVASGKPVDGGTWLELGSAKFAAYAAAHGRRDLSARAIAQGHESAQERLQIQRYLARSSSLVARYLTDSESRKLFGIGVFLALLMIHIVLLALCRTCIFVLNIPTAGVTNRERLTGLLACLVPAMFLIFYAGGPLYAQFSSSSGTPTATGHMGIILLALVAPMALAALVPALQNTARRIRVRGGVDTRPLTGTRFATVTILSGSLMYAALLWAGMTVASLNPNGRTYFFGNPLYLDELSWSPMQPLHPGGLFFCALLQWALMYWIVVMKWRGDEREERVQTLAVFRQTLSDWALITAFCAVCLTAVLASENSRAQKLIDERASRGSHWWISQVQ